MKSHGRKYQLLHKIERTVSTAAALATLCAFVLALYAFVNPATVSDYLKSKMDVVADTVSTISDETGKISENTGKISDEIPYWTILETILATNYTDDVTLYIHNPSNYAIDQYAVSVHTLSGKIIKNFPPVTIPPRERVTLIFQTERLDAAYLCIVGYSRKLQKQAFEWREISEPNPEKDTSSLLTQGWQFSSQGPLSECQ